MSAKGPYRKSWLLFDHLVGVGDQHRRYGDPDSLRRLRVNREPEARRLTKRHFGRTFAVQQPCNLIGGLSMRVDQIAVVGHQTSRQCKIAERIHRWKPQSCGKFDQYWAVG